MDSDDNKNNTGRKLKGPAEALYSNQFAELYDSRSCLEEGNLINQQKDFFFSPPPCLETPLPAQRCTQG